MTNQTLKVCAACSDLDELEGKHHGEAHEGENKDCHVCGATYFEEFDGKVWATNEQAKLNHPELEKL